MTVQQAYNDFVGVVVANYQRDCELIAANCGIQFHVLHSGEYRALRDWLYRWPGWVQWLLFWKRRRLRELRAAERELFLDALLERAQSEALKSGQEVENAISGLSLVPGA